MLNGSALGLYDFHARYYDPVLGRWFNVDPALQLVNPYLYAGNSPMMYTDPDGEFIHLIIGALIGGTINALTGKDGWSWERFAVGAIAGALGAGVGGGISSSMATLGQSGGFMAGFMGTQAATTATSSFVSGLAIGAGAGAASGFTTGFGNALLDGKNFGQALGKGAISGLVGGATGGAIGGTLGGLDAALDGRNFWHGGKVTTDVQMPMLQTHQIGDVDCNYAVAESVDAHYGNARTQAQFQALESGSTGQGLTESEIGKMYAKAGYAPMDVKNATPIEGATNIANTLNSNTPVQLNYQTGDKGVLSNGVTFSRGHATAVTRVKIFDNGRFIIRVMNPGSGSTRFTNLNNMRLIKIVQ